MNWSERVSIVRVLSVLDHFIAFISIKRRANKSKPNITTKWIISLNRTIERILIFKVMQQRIDFDWIDWLRFNQRSRCVFFYTFWFYGVEFGKCVTIQLPHVGVLIHFKIGIRIQFSAMRCDAMCIAQFSVNYGYWFSSSSSYSRLTVRLSV